MAANILFEIVLLNCYSRAYSMADLRVERPIMFIVIEQQLRFDLNNATVFNVLCIYSYSRLMFHNVLSTLMRFRIFIIL